MKVRALTAAVLIPTVLAVVLWGPTGLVAALVGLVLLLSLLEFFALGERVGLHGYRLWAGLCALGVIFQQWASTRSQTWSLSGEVQLTSAPRISTLPLELTLFVFVLGTAAIVFASRRPLAEALGDIGISAAGLVFLALPISTLVRLDGIPEIGPRLLLFTLVLVWAGDTLAYLVGRQFGRRRMAPQLSPKKTWEGAAANLAGSVIAGALLAGWLRQQAGETMLMAALANVAGQAGDLIESAYKRSAGVKDSSKLLPGHGGMLDRIDALLLAAPVVWYYFELVLVRRG